MSMENTAKQDAEPDHFWHEYNNPDKAAELVIKYKLLACRLKDYRDHVFKQGSRVKVDNPRFTGIGEVACQYDLQPDLLAVTLENGNTWWYPIENCNPL